MKFFLFSEKYKTQWNNFVLTHNLGSIHQIHSWKNFQEKIPGRGLVLGFGVLDENNKILASTFCVRMNTGFLNKFWWYSPRGPVFDMQKNLDAGVFLIKKIYDYLKKQGGIFWRIDPYFDEENFQKLENLLNKKINIKISTQNYQPTYTLEINLVQDETEILADMKRKGRYNIKLAQKKGVKIITIPNGNFSKQDLEDFWDLNQETFSRDKFAGHEKKYYENFLSVLKNHAILFFAEYEGKKIATAISTLCGKKFIYYFGASTSDPKFRNLMAPYLLQWEMIKFAKKNNCTSYDFLGIAPENEKNHPYAGITEFKLKFGGNKKNYAQGREIVLNNFWYFLYRLRKKF